MSELKDCPMCGGKPEAHQNSRKTYHYIFCDKCILQIGPHESPAAAAEAWNHRAPVSTPQQSAQRASVDTPEFNELLESFANWQDQETFDALIAHINAWGSGARNSALEEAAKICDETWVCPGDLETESCHEAASKIRGLAAPSPAPQGEQA